MTDVVKENRNGKGLFSFVSGVVLIVASLVLIVAGALTWNEVTNQLQDEHIVVAEDASCQAGEPVDGPYSAYCEAEIIAKHALEATGGKTYAQLERTDPLRQVAQSGSFLRASLYTSVVAYGVAALAIGLGLLFALIGAVFVVKRD